ncbi:MAG: bifunctional precorrin-2 dehydrogenase/sirohydrochlorin ferrochelatase [Desulfovibrio sp.]|jgi:precorrin-2 dehydrogenase/sirohydrochlorin ferrochelatase|nr:bifunctional precorrin-2 dehydrogenase/sirohydrochlorin ferrochelatase [Desulfovibrio sp.]
MENHSPLYPVFLSLKNRHCLVVGLGEVGLRKLAGVLDSEPASVLALDAAPLSEKTLALLKNRPVRFEQRQCREEDISGKTLVFAATGNRAENTRIAGLCSKLGVLCNCAAPPEQGDVFIPAVVRQGRLSLALSTGGASPALAGQWRLELEQWLADRRRAAEFLARLRPLVLDLPHPEEENKQVLRALARSPLRQWLAEGDVASCRARLSEIVPAELHDSLTSLLAESLDDLP